MKIPAGIGVAGGLHVLGLAALRDLPRAVRLLLRWKRRQASIMWLTTSR